MTDTKDSTLDKPKEKRNIFGFRKKENIKIPQLIARILKVPENKVSVFDPKVKSPQTLPITKQNITKFDKDAHEKLLQTAASTDQNISDTNTQEQQSNDEQQSTTSNVTDDKNNNEVAQKSSKKEIPIISKFDFDSSVKEQDQPTIKNVMTNLNTILRLPELGLFANDELEGKTDSVILVEKLIDDEGEKQNPIKEIYIEPFIQIPE